MESNNDRSTNGGSQLVRLNEAIRLTSYSRSSIWRAIRAGTFPTPLRIGSRAIAFRLSELEKWIESRPRVQLNGDDMEGN